MNEKKTLLLIFTIAIISSMIFGTCAFAKNKSNVSEGNVLVATKDNDKKNIKSKEELKATSGEEVEAKSGEIIEEVSGDKAATASVNKASGEKAEKASGEEANSLSGDIVEAVSGEKPEKTSGEKVDVVAKSGDKVEAVSGEKAEKVSGEKVEQVSGEKAEKVSGEKVEQVSGEIADKVSGEEANPLSGEKAESGEKVEEEVIPNDNNEKAWYYNYVNKIVKLRGVEVLDKDYNFHPKENATRNDAFDFLKVVGVTGFEIDSEQVEDEQEFLSKDISREEVAYLSYLYAKAVGIGFKDGEEYDIPFEDKNDVSDEAVEAVAWCYANKILIGRTPTILAPQDYATRAELATIMVRLVEKN